MSEVVRVLLPPAKMVFGTVFPWTLPPVLRRCTPIVHLSTGSLAGWVGIVQSVHHDGVRVAWNGAEPSIERYQDLAVDLGDPTGRAHTAWWIERKLEERTGITKASGMGTPSTPRLAWLTRGHGWRHVLLDLSADDPRTVEDGTPYVDAEALRRVALYLADPSPPLHAP